MIEVKDLVFRYVEKDPDVVRGISFSVSKGEVFGLLGPSGAGKSTTQKILTGLLKGYKGSASILGVDLNGIKREIYNEIGVSFEYPNLYTRFTAIENLRFFSSLYSGNTRNLDELMDIMGLLPDKDKKVEGYSKGMRMRLNFIRALLNNPKLLFLDEPTSGLDPANARKIKDVIKDLSDSGVTVFITTHNMTVADQVCDRVGFMVDGELKLIESPRDLKVEHGKREVVIEWKESGELKREEFPLRGLAENSGFLKTVKTKQIQTIHTQEATLEDIFIKLTGRRLI